MNPVTTQPAEMNSDGVAPAPAGPQTLGQMILDIAARHSGVALQFQRDGRTVYISYSELGTICSEIARGLISLGIERGDRVAILGLTSAEWTLADCGAWCAGAVVAPIYHTNSPDECAHVLADSGARLVFCEDASQAAKIEEIRDRCPALEHVIFFEASTPDAIGLDELRHLGGEVRPSAVQERLAEVSPDDLATLVYTSGTTGPPKGCMLTHTNFLVTTRMYSEQLHFNETHSLYQFLPLAHVLGAGRPDGGAERGGEGHLLDRRREQDRRRAGPDRAHPFPCGAARLREDARRRDRTRRRWSGEPAGPVRLGDRLRNSGAQGPA